MKKVLDVSHWNDIDDVIEVLDRNEDITGIIIKFGEYSFSKQRLAIDSKFEKYYDMALSRGIEIGVYYYSQANDENQAKTEALSVVDELKDYFLTLPVCGDFEKERYKGDHLAKIVAAAGEVIEQAGYYYMAYMDEDNYDRYSNSKIESRNKYGIWIARWAGLDNGYYDTYIHDFRIKLWQYSSSAQDINSPTNALDVSVLLYDLPDAVKVYGLLGNKWSEKKIRNCGRWILAKEGR